MTYQELREELTKLTDDQLNQKVRVWQEEIPLREISSLEIAKEDYIFDSEYSEDGCFPCSELGDKVSDDERDRYNIALAFGEVFLWAD